MHLEDVIDGLSVENRMRACRIVSHHAADRGAIRSRRIGSEEKPHRLQMKIELFLNDAGFNDGPPLFRIYLEHTVEVLRHIDHDRFADRLTGQAGAAASWKNRYFKIAGDLHRSENVLVGSRNDDANRFDLINACVGAVHEPGSPVEADFALDAAFQRLIEIIIHISAESLARLDFAFLA